jgi:hypothetical protein
MPSDYNPDELLPRLPMGDYFAQMFAPQQPPPVEPPQSFAEFNVSGSVPDTRMLTDPRQYAGAPNAASAVAMNTGISALLGTPLAGGQLTGSARLPYLTPPPPEYGQRPQPRLDPRFELRWTRQF